MKVIGLMSGTSVDGIDAALVEITGKNLDLQVSLLDSAIFPYPSPLERQIMAVCSGSALSMAELASLDDAIASEFALAAQKLCKNYQDIAIIGSHGQTVYHRPRIIYESTAQKNLTLGYTLQLGRGELIANLTGIPTVSDFRTSDIAAYGQGAPLVPKVDAALFTQLTKPRCVQNIGGIANVTYLPPKQEPNWEKKIYGWDTGPGNVLLDLAVRQLTQGRQTFDQDGNWAAQGKPNQTLVNQWLKDDFFQLPPPKSTGRELFGEAYLARCWQQAQEVELNAADWLATLTELTVASIVANYIAFLPQMPQEVLLCGGGSRNLYLKQRLQTRLGEEIAVFSTDAVGVSAEFKEAIAFAVLAYWRFHNHFPGNLPQVTGATQETLLGSIYLPFNKEYNFDP